MSLAVHEHYAPLNSIQGLEVTPFGSGLVEAELVSNQISPDEGIGSRSIRQNFISAHPSNVVNSNVELAKFQNSKNFRRCGAKADSPATESVSDLFLRCLCSFALPTNRNTQSQFVSWSALYTAPSA